VEVINSSRSGRLLSVALVALCLAGAVAQAQSGKGNPSGNANGGNGNHNGWSGGAVPTAPEPEILPMAAGGVLLVGGYLAYRLRRRGAGNGSRGA